MADLPFSMPEKNDATSARTREILLEVLEKATEGQLRALRSLRRISRHRPPPRGQRKSNIAIVEDILRSAQSPLHITHILEQAQKRYGRKLSRESLVSALTKKVLDQHTFARVGRNTFDLLHRSSGS